MTRILQTFDVKQDIEILSTGNQTFLYQIDVEAKVVEQPDGSHTLEIVMNGHPESYTPSDNADRNVVVDDYQFAIAFKTDDQVFCGVSKWDNVAQKTVGPLLFVITYFGGSSNMSSIMKRFEQKEKITS